LRKRKHGPDILPLSVQQDVARNARTSSHQQEKPAPQRAGFLDFACSKFGNELAGLGKSSY
jgi:hypothetical protein